MYKFIALVFGLSLSLTLAPSAEAAVHQIYPVVQTWYGIPAGVKATSYVVGDSSSQLCAVQGVGGVITGATGFTFYNYTPTNSWTLQLVEDLNGDNPHVLIGCIPRANFIFPTTAIMSFTPGVSDGELCLTNDAVTGVGITQFSGTNGMAPLWGADSFCSLATHQGYLLDDGANSQFSLPIFGIPWEINTYSPLPDSYYDCGECVSFTSSTQTLQPTFSTPKTIGVANGNNNCNLGDGQDDICTSMGIGVNESFYFCAITGVSGTFDDPQSSIFLLQVSTTPVTIRLYSEHPGPSTPYAGGGADCVSYLTFH
jgi:hypothetical protein